MKRKNLHLPELFQQQGFQNKKQSLMRLSLENETKEIPDYFS